MSQRSAWRQAKIRGVRAQNGFVGAAAFAAAVVTSILLAAPALAASGQRGASARHNPLHAPKRDAGRGTSTNWSGYAVDGTGATSAIGSWTQPTVTCAKGENSWSSPWVGIDGDTSNTVEQTGTDSDCQSGKPVYYAWYEMYPKSLVEIPLTISPGDSITGQVSYASGSFTLALTDHTTGKAFSTVQSSKKAKRSSVEWIMEGPSSGLLSDFHSVSFSSASGAFGSDAVDPGSTDADQITMVTNSGVFRAQPSSVTNGTSFGVTWLHS